MAPLNVTFDSPVNEFFIARGTPIEDGSHVSRLHVFLHVTLVFASVATDQAYKAQVPLPHLELHQRFHIILDNI